MTTGEKLRYLRGDRSQQLVAEEISTRFRKQLVRPVTRDMWANWENDRNPFGWDIAMAIGSYFSVTLDELIRPEVTLAKARRRHRLRAVA